MKQEKKADIESEFIGLLLSAMKKGMTPEEFFSVAQATLLHLQGKETSEEIEKIMKETATPDDLRRLLASFSGRGKEEA